MLEKPADALKVLKKVAVEAQNAPEYQDMLQQARSLNQ
jgi:hypothetical protein